MLRLIDEILKAAVTAVDKDDPALLFPVLRRLGLTDGETQALETELRSHFDKFIPLEWL